MKLITLEIKPIIFVPSNEDKRLVKEWVKLIYEGIITREHYDDLKYPSGMMDVR